MSETVLCLLAFWFMCGLLAGYLYRQRGRSELVGCLGGFLFGPLGIILALVTPSDQAGLARKEQGVEAGKLARGELVKCPHCAELIRPDARVCRYCGRDLPTLTPHFVLHPGRSDSAMLYKKAFDAQYDERDEVKAISYYEMLLSQFPNSSEVPMAKQQLALLTGEAARSIPELQAVQTPVPSNESAKTCAKCGSENPTDFRYCGACGQPF